MQILHLSILQIDGKLSQLIISVKSKISKKILCIYIYTDSNLAVNHLSLTAKFLSVYTETQTSQLTICQKLVIN